MKEFGIDLPGARQQNCNLFNSRYPIVAALMNQVSEETLAIAISKAGGFPSISGYCYDSDDGIINALHCFVDATGSSDLILGVDERSLLNEKLVNTIKDLQISHLLRYENEDPAISDTVRKEWRNITDKLLNELPCRRIQLRDNFNEIKVRNAIYFIKGNDGAGRPGAASTRELFDYHREKTPEALLVPTGGIGTAAQVKYYLESGAVAVGCGTIFAAAEESVLSQQTKERIIASTNKDLSRVDPRLNQLGLVFNKLSLDNLNNTASLKAGIKSSKNGLIFAGHAVDQINSIETVDVILRSLMGHLDKY